MSVNKAIEVEDTSGFILRFERDEAGKVIAQVMGADDSSDEVEIDEIDRRDLGEWLLQA